MTTTTTKEALEPPDRIWIESNDSNRYYRHPPKFSEGIEYSRTPAPIVAPEVDDLLRDAGAVYIVNDVIAGAQVVIRFSELKDAQRLHKALAESRAPASTVAPQQSERPREIFDAGFAATTPPSTLAKAAAEEIISAFPEIKEHDKWVTLGRVKIDIATETETFERAIAPQLPVKDQIAAIIERCLAGGGESTQKAEGGNK